MADIRKKHDQNVSGDFFVDTSCINCDTCRQLAPNTFKDTGYFSSVYNQPADDIEKRHALQAVLSCPTGSIGMSSKYDLQEVASDFPLCIADDVYYVGYNSPHSYGANSYFVKNPEGNWLIDSPKYLPQIINKLEDLGGIKYIFLTHRDDVAHAKKYASKFNSKRVIHQADLSAQPDAEIVIHGYEAVELSKEFLAIPTPGHTRGHNVLLYKNKFLFTGDHLAWEREEKCLNAFRDVCWYSWEEQTKSMEKLLKFKFEWVLPGHGQRIKLNYEKMRNKCSDLIIKMRNNDI